MKSHEEMGVKCWGRSFTVVDGMESSHYLLNGGKLNVPMTDANNKNVYAKDFVAKVGRDVDKGNKNFICELKTPIFRMHIDLDIYQPPEDEDKVVTYDITEGTVKPGPLLREWFTEIQRVMSDLYPSMIKKRIIQREMCGCGPKEKCPHSFHALTAVVCMSPPKRGVVKEKVLFNKVGVHVIWPFIKCDAATALNIIRSAWVQHFQHKYGLRHKQNPWESVFDRSIFEKNGLRMVGSDKMEQCPSCKGKKSKSGLCQTGSCDGSGRYPENRVYRVVDVLLTDGTSDVRTLPAVTSCGVNELMATYIRIPFTKATKQPNGKWKNVPVSGTEYTIPEWFDANFFLDDDDETNQHKLRFDPTPAQKLAMRRNIEMMKENQEGETRFLQRTKVQNFERLSSNGECTTIIKDWITSKNLSPAEQIPECYQNADIIDVKRCVGSGEYPYYLVRINSCFCMNVGREHENNSVFFLINEQGLFQKCFCTCDTKEGRRDGRCRDYASTPFRMPEYVTKVLFPGLYLKHRLAEQCNIDTMYLDDEKTGEMMLLKMQELDQQYDQLNLRRKSYMLNPKHPNGRYERYEERFRSKRV